MTHRHVWLRSGHNVQRCASCRLRRLIHPDGGHVYWVPSSYP